METAMVRESWTDERLDDFRGETARRFDEVDRRFDEVDRRFGEVKGEIRDLRQEILAMRSELHGDVTALHRLVIQVGAGLFGTFVVGFLGVLATAL
jgi:hypothetical protein